MTSRAILPATLLSIGLSGCWLAKTKPVTPPAPLAPAPAASQPAATHPATDESTKVPIDEPPPPLQPTEAPAPAQLPAATLPPNTARRPPVRKPEPPKPEPAAATPATPAPAAPRLGEILTDPQRRQYEADFDRSVAQARAAVGRVPGRTLTAAQRESVERIRTFLQRAEELKTTDLATALQLARRAALLGEDLVKSLQ